MSEELQNKANSLHDNQVPAIWANRGFLSHKPLASWVMDLNECVKFLDNWIDDGENN